MTTYQTNTMQAQHQHRASTVQATCKDVHASPAQIEDRVIQLHRDITSIIRRKVGMLEPFAAQLAGAILDGLREDFGGATIGGKGSIYIPAPDKSARNAAIRAEFNGTNAAEVCKKHNIGKTTLYRIAGDRP